MKPPHEAVIEFDEDRSQPDFSFFRGPPTPAQIQAFERFAKHIVTQGVNGVWKEFKLHVMKYTNFTKVAFSANEKKNRYSDVYCGDATRVILPDNGYIHANYVKGPPLAFPFILTQGPLPTTVGDFWKMIDVCKVNQIVMLCDNVEMGRHKCEPYIPKKPGDVFEAPGGYKISFANGKNGQPDVVNEKLVVTTKFLMHTPTGGTRKIRHYHYSSWPDVSTPSIADMAGLMKIMEPIRNNKADQPVVVHCSAGIGRTGTLVAIEMCLHQLLGDPSKPLCLVEIAKKLRDQRAGSIQVEIQYLMIPVGVFEYGIKHGYIKDTHLLADLEKFTAEYDRLSQDEESPQSLPLQPVKLLPPPPPKAQTSRSPATAKSALSHPPATKQSSAEKTAPLLSAISSAPSAMTQVSVIAPCSTMTQASTMSQASAMTQASVLAPVSAMTQASVLAPASAMTQASVLAPVSAMTQASVLAPVSAMTQASVLAPVSAMTQASVLAPASAMTQASVLAPASAMTQVSVLAPNSAMTQASVLDPASAMTQVSVLAPASTMTQASTMSVQQKTGPLLSVRTPESVQQKTGPLLSVREPEESTTSNAASAMTQVSTMSQQKTGPLLSVHQPESAMSDAASVQKTGPLLSVCQPESAMTQANSAAQSAMTQVSTLSSAPSTMSMVMTAKPMTPVMSPPGPVPRVMRSLSTKTAVPMPPRMMHTPVKTAAPPHLIAPIVPPHHPPNPPMIRPPVPHPPVSHPSVPLPPKK